MLYDRESCMIAYCGRNDPINSFKCTPGGIYRRGDMYSIVRRDIEGLEEGHALANGDRQVSRMRNLLIGLKVTDVISEIMIGDGCIRVSSFHYQEHSQARR